MNAEHEDCAAEIARLKEQRNTAFEDGFRCAMRMLQIDLTTARTMLAAAKARQ